MQKSRYNRILYVKFPFWQVQVFCNPWTCEDFVHFSNTYAEWPEYKCFQLEAFRKTLMRSLQDDEENPVREWFPLLAALFHRISIFCIRFIFLFYLFDRQVVLRLIWQICLTILVCNSDPSIILMQLIVFPHTRIRRYKSLNAFRDTCVLNMEQFYRIIMVFFRGWFWFTA